MSLWKFYLLMAAPLLEAVSKTLKNKDADDVGPDDRAAAFLHYAAVAITALANDQPLPTMPASVKS
jgi:hypothetical protein